MFNDYEHSSIVLKHVHILQQYECWQIVMQCMFISQANTVTLVASTCRHLPGRPTSPFGSRMPNAVLNQVRFINNSEKNRPQKLPSSFSLCFIFIGDVSVECFLKLWKEYTKNTDKLRTTFPTFLKTIFFHFLVSKAQIHFIMSLMVIIPAGPSIIRPWKPTHYIVFHLV